eukprot:gene7542-11351_t
MPWLKVLREVTDGDFGDSIPAPRPSANPCTTLDSLQGRLENIYGKAHARVKHIVISSDAVVDGVAKKESVQVLKENFKTIVKPTTCLKITLFAKDAQVPDGNPYGRGGHEGLIVYGFFVQCLDQLASDRTLWLARGAMRDIAAAHLLFVFGVCPSRGAESDKAKERRRIRELEQFIVSNPASGYGHAEVT